MENENAKSLADRLSNLAAEKILTNIENILQQKANFEEQNLCLTIGDFDGVHKGHQFIIDEIISKSNSYNLVSAVMSFTPHPRIFFGNSRENFNILTKDEKLKILNKMGIKTILKKDSIKIYGNPNLKVKNNIIIKNFLKDHRVFMSSVVAALAFGGNWKIFDKDSVKTSFPTFISKIKSLGAKFH